MVADASYSLFSTNLVEIINPHAKIIRTLRVSVKFALCGQARNLHARQSDVRMQCTLAITNAYTYSRSRGLFCHCACWYPGLSLQFFLATQLSASKSYVTQFHPKQKNNLPNSREVSLLSFTEFIKVRSYFSYFDPHSAKLVGFFFLVLTPLFPCFLLCGSQKGHAAATQI